MDDVLAGAPPAEITAHVAWRRAAYAYALVVAAVLAYFLLGLTVQVSDSLGNLLAVQHATLRQLVWDQGFQHGYLRPLLWAQIKIVYELADGRYYLWFRGVHVVQAIALILLCVRLMQPRTAIDAALVPGALAVLVGSHTFAPTVREAFPINSFLTVMVCCAAAANIALARKPRWWTDTLACVLLAGAALTVESGLLVWVVCAAAWLLGGRGLSRSALVLMTGMVAAYLAFRLGGSAIGGPGLGERATGFGFGIVEPAELVRRFGAHPFWFYVYNVASSLLTVLFAEPKGGVWRFAYELTVGRLDAWTVVSVASSTGATLVVGWYLWHRRGAIAARMLDRDDQIVLLFGAVLIANAVLSYSYTKNVIMSPAGMFLAPAVFVASRRLLMAGGPQPAAAALAAILALNAGWAYRVVGTHYNLRYTAVEQRNEWARVDQWLADQHLALDGPDAHALRDTLQRDAVYVHETPPPPPAGWARWFDIDW